ncbi:OstA-like protein [Echinicola vietnamensis]|uniref:Organic solvent tolerance protein OstA n=1 Tax=Echinicola vietnamensis (strain DSM 17526 / LMG 23754 / KMM 6221) TaxID=926556 RepID=L0G0C3_ECHVK|nr:OstA-like protein [Echinicola vietnamensis]AGA78325.1 organic solvent tolerance protein OstA [Echinicola vietnamensis DSM 17526]
MLKKTFTYFVTLWCFILSAQLSKAQQSRDFLGLNKADSIHRVEATQIQKVYGNIIMKQKEFTIYCDSAYYDQKGNKSELFGNVRIENPKDTITITCYYADYNGNTYMAKLRDNVVFVKAGTTLYTNFLDYNRRSGVAEYFNSGKVVDSTNVLTSQKGLYETQEEKITFTDNVILVNPEYTLKSNILYYFTVPKIAETEGLTNIRSEKGDELNAKKGSYYDTQNKLFRFYEGDVENETSKVTGDELFYDETKKYYEGKDNVSIFNKERNIEVFGDVGKYWEEKKYSEVYGNALVQKYFEADTMYMAADTLISQDSEAAANRHMLAYPNTRMIKGEMSGRADSTVYMYADSTIYLYGDPLLWNNKSQISADSIHFLIANEDIDRAFLKDNAFAITADTIANFNQIKGRQMVGFFEDGDMSLLEVEGNGESLYFALENDTTLQGVNSLLCGKIFMHFENGNVVKINHTINPEASFTPPHMLNEENTKLEGFVWRAEERPTLEILLEWRTPIKQPENPQNLFNEPNIRIPYPDEDDIQLIIEKWLKDQAKTKS